MKYLQNEWTIEHWWEWLIVVVQLAAVSALCVAGVLAFFWGPWAWCAS